MRRPYYIDIIICLLIVLAVAGGVAWRNHSIDSASGTSTSGDCYGARAIMHQDKCGNPYGVANPNYMRLGDSDSYLSLISTGHWCKGGYNEFASDQTKFCTLGDKHAKRSIILFGDSHAQHYQNAFDYIGRTYGYRVLLYDYTGCTHAKYSHSSACGKRLDAILAHKSEFKSADLVVVSFLYHNFSFMKRNIDYVRSLTDSPLVVMEDNAHTTATRLNSCYFFSVDCTWSRAKATSQSDKVTGKLISSRTITEKQLIYTQDFYCHSDTCYLAVGGVPVYYNTSAGVNVNSHMTASYSYSLGPLIAKRLQHTVDMR